MRKTDKNLPVAVVLHLGATGLSIVRSLGRRGIPVIGLDTDRKQIGLLSKYCKEMTCPDPHESEEKLLELLLNLGKQLNSKGVLFPASDDYVLFISRHREILKEYYRFAMPSQTVVENAVSKKGLYNLALQNNIPVPKSYFPNNIEEVKSLAKEIDFPCIIKPVYSLSWRRDNANPIVGYSKVIKVNSPDELVENYTKVVTFDKNVVIQEIIQGEDNRLYKFIAYLDRNSEPLGFIVGRKLRTLPIHFGSSTFAESVWNDDLIELGTRLLKGIGYQGLVGAEFKKDVKDNRFKLVEINARFGLFYFLATACGVDLPFIAYQDITGNQVEKVTSYRTGIKWVYGERDLYAYLGYRRAGELTLIEWLKSLRGKKVHAVFAWDDLMPFVRYSLNFSKVVLRRLIYGKNSH